MQHRKEFYDPQLHDKFHALTVKQPYASSLLEFKEVAGCNDPKEGLINAAFAQKSIEVRSKKTKYRGDLLICASKNPANIGLPSGCTIGLVELYDIKRVEDFTEQDWENTCIPKERRAEIKTGYGWMTRNPRRVIEMPTMGQLGIYPIYFTKGCINEYPRLIDYDVENFTKNDLKKINENGKAQK